MKILPYAPENVTLRRAAQTVPPKPPKAVVDDPNPVPVEPGPKPKAGAGGVEEKPNDTEEEPNDIEFTE
jgi:hypothetical protein